MSPTRVVSASGIRGVVGDGLDPVVAGRYAVAFGTWLRRRAASGGGTRPGPGEDAVGGAGPKPSGHLLLARDSRPSGELFGDAVAAGLRATGWDVRDLGLCPTPTALLAVEDDGEAAGAVVITASHNPAPWNGLKLVGRGGRFLSPAAGRAVQALFEAEEHALAPWDALGERTARPNAVAHHTARILGLTLVQPERIRRAGFTVALDCVHGAGGTILPNLLERLGCRVRGIGLATDGRFPRDPEPAAEHLNALAARVRDDGADLGMAVDPDVDRLSLVDGGGRPIGEDWTLALAVELVLSHGSGPVVTNLSTSRVVEDAAHRHGQPCFRTPVGEANVAAEMERRDAPVGGEGNGGVMLAALHLTRDAPLAAALVLQLLAERERGLADLLAPWPVYHAVKERAPLPDRPLEQVYAAVEAGADPGAEADSRDGLRLAWEEARAWLHVRPSGTEPILRLIAEAPEEDEARRLVRVARDALE